VRRARGNGRRRPELPFPQRHFDLQVGVPLPIDYPDQQALADALIQERDDFIGWVARAVPHGIHYQLDIIGEGYRSGTPASGTLSLMLTIGSDAGVHPVTTYRGLNFDLEKHVPITVDTLFKPGTQPLDTLNPIVQRELDKHGGTARCR
jgi:hypothetical protein